MRRVELRVGFMPLVDAAPLIAAAEMGYAEEEGLALTLEASPSWSLLRDKLCFGHLDAAHLLAPVPIAGALGLGGGGALLHALSVLSINGTVIGVSRPLATELRALGHDFGFIDARAAGEALIAVKGEGLRVGVPFPFSMHAELVYYWLSALGLEAPGRLTVRTVPPPQMADAMEAGEIDAFCVGEPWGSRSVELGVAELLLPGAAIWAFAPEKVLAVRADWIEANRAAALALIRATWRAARWLAEPSSRGLATELLAQPQYLNLPAELLENALIGSFVISPEGARREAPQFMDFFSGAAGFPWRSQAEWIARQLAARVGLDPQQATRDARATFRSDLYREALGKLVRNMPAGSTKVEGAISDPMAVGSTAAGLILPRDSFFDGRIFEPGRQ